MKHPDDRDIDLDQTPPDGSDGSTRREESRPGEKKRFDPYHFAATTLPPGLRARLIAAELPVVPQEQLEDTAPPGRVQLAPGASEPSPSPPESVERTDPARWVRQRTRQRLFVVAAVVAFVIVVGLAIRMSGRSEETAASSQPPLPSTAVQPTVPEPDAVRSTSSPLGESTSAPAVSAIAELPSDRPEPTTVQPVEKRTPTRSLSLPKPESLVAPPPQPAAVAPAIAASGGPLDRLIVVPDKE